MTYQLGSDTVPAGDTPLRPEGYTFPGIRPRSGDTSQHYFGAPNGTRGMFLNFFRPAAAGMLRLPQLIVSMPAIYYPGYNLKGTGLRKSVLPPQPVNPNG